MGMRSLLRRRFSVLSVLSLAAQTARAVGVVVFLLTAYGKWGPRLGQLAELWANREDWYLPVIIGSALVVVIGHLVAIKARRLIDDEKAEERAESEHVVAREAEKAFRDSSEKLWKYWASRPGGPLWGEVSGEEDRGRLKTLAADVQEAARGIPAGEKTREDTILRAERAWWAACSLGPADEHVEARKARREIWVSAVLDLARRAGLDPDHSPLSR